MAASKQSTPYSEAYERGKQWGAYYKKEGRDYSISRSSYPSNPYHASDPRCAEYDNGYQEGFQK